MAVAGGVRRNQSLENGRIIVWKERLLKNVVGNLEVDAIVDVKGLVQKWKGGEQDQNDEDPGGRQTGHLRFSIT